MFLLNTGPLNGYLILNIEFILKKLVIMSPLFDRKSEPIKQSPAMGSTNNEFLKSYIYNRVKNKGNNDQLGKAR